MTNTDYQQPALLNRHDGKRIASWLVLLLMVAAFAGCQKKAWTSIESESNGYLCQKCGFKFYTEHQVFPDFCPQCKDVNVRPVVEYRCDKCGHTNISAEAHGGVHCEKCPATLSASLLPHEAELLAWGAVKKTRKDVCQ